MSRLLDVRVGCAMTGSFCTFKRAFEAWRTLAQAGARLTPILSFNAATVDTRFYPAREAAAIFEEIAGRKALRTLSEVEPIGPKRLLDALIIAPCTGNTLAKLSHGVADTPVTLAAKSHLRNGRPLVIAVSTNDALGRNAENIGRLMAAKHCFFVPMRQDDPLEKPDSIVAEFQLLKDTLQEALENRQIQPVLR